MQMSVFHVTHCLCNRIEKIQQSGLHALAISEGPLSELQVVHILIYALAYIVILNSTRNVVLVVGGG